MAKIDRSSLMTLEAYSRERSRIRASVIQHKKNRKIGLGQNLTLMFEDETTVRYQVHEMLRAQRIFEEGEILEELRAYNPLIPDGSNLKATMMLEYPDPVQRADALSRLRGVEDTVWVSVTGFPRVWAIADEDLDRENEKKTSAVHFLRFELTPEMIGAFRSDHEVDMGVEHLQYSASTRVPVSVRNALALDFS